MRHKLFPADELAAGAVRSVRVGPVDVAVLKTPDGRIFALRDQCSHFGAPLSKGRLTALVVADDSTRYNRDYARWTLRCPWHGFEFDVESGICPADPVKSRVRTYPVSIEDGFIVVER